jgi:predicted HD superfamily hydrolase involved in NAD metabolism
MNIEEIKNKLKQMIPEKRYTHSLKVMETSRKLAVKYGENAENAALAGLIHDCARGLTVGETFELCAKFNITVDSIMRQKPILLHGEVGAFLAAEEFGIDDSAILEAVRVHTLGKENMDKLSSIVFIADYIEPGRSFAGVERIRKAAEISLEKAIVAGIDSTIGFNLEKGGLLHPQAIITRNWALGMSASV